MKIYDKKYRVKPNTFISITYEADNRLFVMYLEFPWDKYIRQEKIIPKVDWEAKFGIP